MPTRTGQNMMGSVPTLAELTIIAQNIEDMIKFNRNGEITINGLPTRPNEEQFILAVHELTTAIIG